MYYRASLFSFQRLPEKFVDMDELDAAHSTVQKYLGIDRRTGLVAIGDRLLKGNLRFSVYSDFLTSVDFVRYSGIPDPVGSTPQNPCRGR